MTGRIEYLDGLRGIAAFTVFLGHFIPLFLALVPVFSVLAYTGRSFSVCVFFVLSGYVLTHPFFLTGNYELIQSGAVRRYVRLLIPILFLLALVYLFVYPGIRDLFNLTALQNTVALGFVGVFQQWQDQPIQSINPYLGVLWTMAIEFIGSFFVFGFAALFGRFRNRWILYLVAVLLVLHTYYLAFVLGMLLADLSTCITVKIPRPRAIALIALASVAVIILATYPETVVYEGTYAGVTHLSGAVTGMIPDPGIAASGATSLSGFIHIVGAFLLLLILLNSAWLKGILSTKIPVFLGKISFSLYLIHMFVIYKFSYFLQFALFPDRLGNPVTGFVILLMTIPVVLGASYAMYLYVDRSGIALSKMMYERVFRRTASAG